MTQVRMTARTVFANDRITVFPEGGPAEGVKGGAVTSGQTFETDLAHAKDLDQLGHAEPVNRADLDNEPTPLEPHFTVSVPELVKDQERHASTDVVERTDEAPAESNEETAVEPVGKSAKVSRSKSEA